MWQGGMQGLTDLIIKHYHVTVNELWQDEAINYKALKYEWGSEIKRMHRERMSWT